MRHIYNIGMAALMLFAAISCQKETEGLGDNAISSSETAVVTFDLRQDTASTKADGSIADTYSVWYEIYEDSEASATRLLNGQLAVTEGNVESLSLELPKGKAYKALFFAVDKNSTAYSGYDTDLRKVTVDYSKMMPGSANDVFSASESINVKSDQKSTVVLKRPMAQINLADKNDAFGYDNISLTLSAGTVLDVTTGKCTEYGQISTPLTECSNDAYAYKADHYLHYTMYVLPSGSTSDIDVALTKQDGSGISKALLTVENVTIEPNTRVNIIADDLIKTIPAENISSLVTLTPSDIENNAYAITSNGTYNFSGAFDGKVNITVAENLNVVIDGSDAEFDDQISVIQRIAGGADAVTGQRNGSYTVTNVKAKVLSVAATGTELKVLNNTAEAIDIDGTNVVLDVTGNTVNSTGVEYNRVDDGGKNDYGIYLYLANYVLTLNDNTVQGSGSHSIAINGKYGNDLGQVSATNEIRSFTGNSLTIGKHEDGRAGLKIWDDQTYAPNNTTMPEVTESLIATTKDANTFIKSGEYQNAYKYNIYDQKCESL